MALQSLPGVPFVYPPAGGSNIGPSVGGGFIIIDADGEKIAFSFPFPKSGDINRVGFYISTVTQNPTNGLKVSLQSLDASGLPDGTPLVYRNVPTGDISANTWVETGLLTDDGTDTGNPYTATQGEMISVVIEFESFVLGDSLNISRVCNNIFYSHTTAFTCYGMGYTSSWSKSGAGSGPMQFAIQYSDNNWEPFDFSHPASAALAVNTTSSTTPDVYGNYFTCPVNMGVTAFLLHMYLQNNTSTFKLYLLDANDNVLATATPADIDNYVGLNTVGAMYLPFDDATSVNLTVGTNYRVVVEATGAGAIRLHGYSAPSASYMTAMPGGETTLGTTRKDSGAWTNSTVNQYAIGLLVSSIEDGSGGSSTYKTMDIN